MAAPDTGLLHLAIVLGVPVLGLFGSSDPVVAGIPEGAGEVLRTGIACSPCRERTVTPMISSARTPSFWAATAR